MTTYLIHKAVEFDAMTAKAKKLLGVSTVEELAAIYDMQHKYDGCNAIVQLPGISSDPLVHSRTGELVTSCQHIGRSLRMLLQTRLLRGERFVVLGEVWHHRQQQRKTNGDFRRADPSPHLQFAAFDLLTMEEFEAGHSDRPYKERYSVLHSYLRGFTTTDCVFLAATYHAGTYPSSVRVGAKELVSRGGYDGLILRDPRAGWTAGSGSNGEIVKVKDEVSFDLLVTGVEEGKGKLAGHAGKLVCTFKDGTVIKVAGGTYADRKAWFEDPALIVGKIVKVEALERFPNGQLREPRMTEVRTDKETHD
jgi:DNA ligase-1